MKTSVDVDAFLLSGGIFSYDEQHVVISWGRLSRSKQYQENKYSFYIPDFFLQSENPWQIPEFSKKIKRSDLIELMDSFSEVNYPVKWQEPSFKEFEFDFNVIQKAIGKGIIKKAVPIVFELGRINNTLPFRIHILQNILKAPSNLRIYGFWNRKEGLLGASPETLFNVKNSHDIFTMALAGTRPHAPGEYLEDDAFLNDSKERNEHQIVIDVITEKFRQKGEVRLSNTKVMHLNMLDHLETDITVNLAETMDLEDVVTLLHPTPALGLASEKLTFQSLKTFHNQRERNHFGAPFGIRLPNGECYCLVAIRNIQWKGKELMLGSGCGIVQNSRLNNEWNELKAKRNSVKEMLRL